MPSHPTIRARVRSLQRRWLLLCLSEIGQTLLLFSCCPRVVSPHLTSHQPPTAKIPKLVQSTARGPGSGSGSWVRMFFVDFRGRVTPPDLMPKYACTDSCPCGWLPVQRHRECYPQLMLLSSESIPLAACHLAVESDRDLLPEAEAKAKAKINTSPRSSLMQHVLEWPALRWTSGKHLHPTVHTYLCLRRPCYSSGL